MPDNRNVPVDYRSVPYDELIDAIMENLNHETAIPYSAKNKITKRLNEVRDMIRPYAT